MKRKKLGIWGWWQGNNLGDNWIKKVLLHLFPYAEFIDTSVQNFRKYDFIICGGGGLFVFDVIPPWNRIHKNLAYGILGLGAEFPHKSQTATLIYKNSRFFYVRDQYSLNCMHLENTERSYDLTFALPLKWNQKEDINLEKAFLVWRDIEELVNYPQFLDYIQPGGTYDEWNSIIRSAFSTIIENDFQTQNDNIEEIFSDSGFVISARYHGIVAAIQKGLPFIAIDVCPKIRALLQECGLDEYCIKISETEKLSYLIDKAKKEIDYIRDKEKKYREAAHKTLFIHIHNAQLEVLKIIIPLNIIHYGSYWMKENDVINVMADDLKDKCNLKKIDLKVYTSHPDKRIKINRPTPNGCLCMLDDKSIMKDINHYKADAIILNSGGLYLSDNAFQKMTLNNITTVGISLSDPDVFPYNGKIYADKFDLFYTNSKYSLNNEYNSTTATVSLLPFAASPKHHYYMPNIRRDYDVVIVAHAREDRKPIVAKLETICKVGTYGSGWEHSLGIVNGLEHVKAINKGKMYLSFAKTAAGFDNVKVGLFEAMACNQVVITSYMDELQDYFIIGKEILCYHSEEELYDLIRYYLNNEKELECIRKNGYLRFLKCHTYKKRWNNVLQDIYVKKGLIKTGDKL